MSLESGERGPIYSLSYEGIQHEATQGGTHPVDPVVPLQDGSSTAQLEAVVPRLRVLGAETLRAGNVPVVPGVWGAVVPLEW